MTSVYELKPTGWVLVFRAASEDQAYKVLHELQETFPKREYKLDF